MDEDDDKLEKEKNEAATTTPIQFNLPTLTLDPPTQDKSNYRAKYDPALDSSLVKKSAGPLCVSFCSTMRLSLSIAHAVKNSPSYRLTTI